MKNLIKLFAVSALLAGMFACDKQHQPAEINQDFSRYISGYTFGQISTKAVIQIELAEDLPQIELGTEVKDQLFSLVPALGPSVKGKTYWKTRRLVEFTPDEPLKEGTAYRVNFHLGKVLPKLDKEFQTFIFDVYTAEQNFSIREAFYKPIADNQNRWNNMTVEITAADALTDSEAQYVFKAKMSGKDLPVRLVNSSNSGLNFRFLVDSLERTSADQTLKLICDGKAINGTKTVEKEIVIHAVNAEIFKVISTQSCEAPERCIQIVFTDPLGKQDLKGLIEITDFENYTLKADKNVVTLYPETNFPEIISGRIDKNIRSFAGKKLPEDFTFNLTKAPEKPVVRLLSSGNILPDSKNLLLPFSAVNVRAVEMRIIKIYEHNVLSFLQENQLDGSDNLARAGRLVAKKLLRLDQDKSKVLTKWNNFAVDISALVEKEPGAIYRFELIIRREFSLYPCDSGDSEPAGNQIAAFDENNFILTDADLSSWNRGEYYSPVRFDYSLYDWNKEDDPCHPTFYMQEGNVVVRTNLLATNVGIIAKKGDGADLFITAQDIRTTEPLSGSRVRVLNYQLAPVATGTTDRNGFCLLSLKTDEAFIVEVTHGGQKGYLKVSNGNELSLSRFDVSGRSIRKGLKGFIYGERGIWRPGDEIFMTFILEDRQKSIPAGHPVTVDIYNPQGQFYRKLVQTNPVGNFYSFAFKTEEQAPTGSWRAVVSVGGTQFERSLQIETIKPNRLKINVDFGTELIEKSRMKIAVDAKWLHGAVAKDLGTKVLLRLRPTATRFKGYENYNFNNPTTEAYSYEEEIYSGHLDETGHTEFYAQLPDAEAAAGMLSATFTTSVEESGGGESLTINSLTYSPFPAYAGLNVHLTSENDILATDTTHYFDVVLLDAKGKPVPSGEVVYKAYRLGWSWWWGEEEGRSKLSSVVNGSHITPVIDKKVTIKNGKARVPFKMGSAQWGRYLIYIMDTNGGHATGKQVLVDDPYWGGRSRQDDPQGLTMLSFTTDKHSYTVGEDVKITLGKAGNGRALVSLENGTRTVGHWWEATKSQEPTVIQFKVTEELAPNFYIHITQLQHHDQTINDLPIRLYGVVPVTVVHPLGELKPTISMPDALRSEKEFTIAIGETNRQHMTYTLAIVDEGLLDINNFKTPNPYAEFNAREALGVKTYDRYNQVVGAFSGELRPLFSIGGGEGLDPSADKNSQRFKPVVKFMGPFELKAGAADQHKIKLPPYVGSVRVMVVAANDRQAYGRAEKTVPVQNPLMVLTTLPRVLGPGEEVLMPVNIFVMDKTLRNVKVEVQSGDLLQLQEGASKNVTFSDIGDELVFFKMKVKKQTGKVKVVIKASSGQETSTETIDIEVRNPNPQLTVFESFIVKPGESREISYEFNDEQPDNQVKMEYARIPSVNLGSSLQYLIGYPHGCSEQSTSKAFPQLFLHNFANLSPKQKQDVQGHVNAVIKKLYTMQTGEGGISIWSGSSQADEWVTSFVGHFMASARDQGYSVSQSFINDWKKFQKRRVNNWRAGNYTDDLIQSYRLYSLAIMGDPDIAAMNRLRERASLSLPARWQLASAYAISGRKDAARQLVNNQKAQAESYASAFNNSYGSSVRDDAIIMEACILMDDMAQALTIAGRISDYLNGNNYSTQTTAWALLAMARFADKSGKGNLSFTTTYLGKTNKVETQSPVHMEDLTDLKKSGKVRVTNNGGGNVYAGRTMISTPLEDRSPAVRNNLAIQVEFEDLDGRTLNVSKLDQGTDFRVNITVTNTSVSTRYTNLALTHIIPSGWEIFNTRLGDGEETSSSPDGITYQDIRDDRVLSYFDLAPTKKKTVSIRVQAAYLGRFFMPAVACQAMYDNTVYARTTGSWIEVVKQ
ncbi:MAG: MG2 domain-containing protein [Chitinispirillia bacterium]|nr:MG2 domain-containing protein [Chitinispirillia bacterium]